MLFLWGPIPELLWGFWFGLGWVFSTPKMPIPSLSLKLCFLSFRLSFNHLLSRKSSLMWLWQTWIRSLDPCSLSLGLHLPFVAGLGEHVEVDRAVDKSRPHFICLCFSALSSGSFISVFLGNGIILSGSGACEGYSGGACRGPVQCLVHRTLISVLRCGFGWGCFLFKTCTSSSQLGLQHWEVDTGSHP